MSSNPCLNCFLLFHDDGIFQAHFERCALPISDYVTDTRSVLDQTVRVINAMLDIAAGFGLLETTLGLLKLHQMVVQVCAVVPLKNATTNIC